jgi:hypothetical protein
MWQVNCAVNTAKALLPFQNELRMLKRRLIPSGVTPSHETVVSGGYDHMDALRAAGMRIEDARILEVGSGWLPIIPLMFRLAGAETVYLTDAYRLMSREAVIVAAEFLLARKVDLAKRLNLTVAEVEESLSVDEGADMDGLLQHFSFVYLAPFDAAGQMPYVDAVVSQTVFEHIKPDALPPIIDGLMKGLRPGGLMSHGVDNTDHRANDDPRLSRFDFLRYSDSVWSLFCINPQDYTNRLRHSDYVALFRQSGCEIVFEKRLTTETGLADVQSLPLSDRFRNRDPEDLAAGWSHLVVRVPSL